MPAVSQPLGKMSSKKRVSVSPASVSTAVKRQRAADENEELQCLICFELVVDAVQVRCCGALHCRACISKCDKCPQCRKPVNADAIVPDVRCERLSAAAIRPCSYAEEGCVFKANRTSIAAHEEMCDYVPRSVLRAIIQKLKHDKDEHEIALVRQTRAHMMEKLCLIQENSAISERAEIAQYEISGRAEYEKNQMQQALVKCALEPQPAKAALRVLYEMPADREVFEIDRFAAIGRSHEVWFEDEIQVALHVHESNHNVAVWLIKRQPAYDTKFPHGQPAMQRLKIDRILHPYDTTLAKDITPSRFDLRGKQRVGFANFMTSKQLDEYCVNGKYYIA